MKYLTEFGLAVRGLSRHHGIDPLDFDKQCDSALPLDNLLRPDPMVKALFRDIDRDKVNVWSLTNAYKNHAFRVLQILELEDEMDGVVFCDYGVPNFSCKPEAQFYELALMQAGVRDSSRCFFIDDSLANVQAAKKLGWGSCVYFCEKDASSSAELSPGTTGGVDHVISDLGELRRVWPEIFRRTPTDLSTSQCASPP
ncbi:Haloacid dehalogenase-like hydrolase-domain-containing protein [Cantharellus anzutake]|uniref:Haloacid dehalogenase-like hydrolase-domain-containing protein n=1 Tax=Cantharellus anzutake TaxID=1750568 RepID=UPI00190420CE|nr:Haloacid dehalogenase-like hydrolase-domain-containing protein [Cantharellus anzutake]KAF8335019.1 Haloacid dehalogenase-like hydrolase-domain-containing protein [Cantharellus anzutake]